VIVRALGALAIAMVGLAPVTTVVAASPGPPSLTSALADPVEAGFTEMDLGSANALEGYFDAKVYARNTVTDSKEQQTLVDALNSWGFVTGYGREWYLPRQSDWLGELVMVFRDVSQAEGYASSSKVAYARDPAFQTFIDVPNVPKAYGLTEVTQSPFHWTIVIFTKQNDLFAVERGSRADFMTQQGVAQAEKAFSVAPNGTSLVEQSGPLTATFNKYVRPLAIVVLIGSLISGAVLAILVFVIFSRGSQRPPTVEAPRTP